MTEQVIVAIITGIATVIAVILTNSKNSREMDAKLDKSQAVTETKLDLLTDEVRKHNNFAQRIPVLEEKIEVANHRIADLEDFQKRSESNADQQRVVEGSGCPCGKDACADGSCHNRNGDNAR